MPKKKEVKKVAKVKKVLSEEERIARLLVDRSTVTIDLGCGENKQPGSIGVDFRGTKGVDIEQDLSKFPWAQIPDEAADVVFSSHLLEHINPDSPDPRIAGLVDLLKDKKIITEYEIAGYIGETKYQGGFIRFMDEVWRILKPGGQFISTFPYAGSEGYFQDPTHVNPITPVTLAYFDPLAKDEVSGRLYNLYTLYRPYPWKILRCFYDVNGFMEVALEKRIIDPSYRVLKNGNIGGDSK